MIQLSGGKGGEYDDDDDDDDDDEILQPLYKLQQQCIPQIWNKDLLSYALKNEDQPWN